MKNYNKILEAVNKGILLALDDFDDVEQVLNIKSKQVYDRDYTKDYLDLMKIVVDLGLPSGTLWCKYNLGCDYDLLNNDNPYNHDVDTPDWYGGYYAWGELLPNTKFDNYTYKFGWNEELKKYDGTDNLTKLQPEDDAATLNLHIGNYKCYIPTVELFKELRRNTTYKIKEMYNGHQGLTVVELTSKINGNKIVFPMCGFYEGTSLKFEETEAAYWTSSVCTLDWNYAYIFSMEYLMYIKQDENTVIDSTARPYGLQIRPVINL